MAITEVLGSVVKSNQQNVKNDSLERLPRNRVHFDQKTISKNLIIFYGIVWKFSLIERHNCLVNNTRNFESVKQIV